jgi:hypothetical protein
MQTEVTMRASAGVLDVAKKQEGSAFRTTPVKIETGLVRKARTIADDKGVDLSEYLSGLIRGAVDRDWTKILKKIAESESDGQ